MPKLRTPATELENRQIIAKIKYGMEMQKVTHDELALAARVTPQTLYNRYKRPEEFRLYELRQIAAKLHTTVTELIG